jgi:hypothetical protein
MCWGARIMALSFPKITRSCYGSRGRDTSHDTLALTYDLPPTLDQMICWARGKQQWKIVQEFFTGPYQHAHLLFARLFPTSNWRIEDIAFLDWYRFAQVPTHQGNWGAEECRRLDLTLDEFENHLDDVKTGAVEKPAWAKNLPPPATAVGYCGHFGSDQKNR